MLKLLHIADLHLDSPMKKLSYEKAKEFKMLLRQTFRNAVDFAAKENCRAVLISGDLFDTEFYSKETVEFLANEFLINPSIEFVIAPGNHDPINSSSPYVKFKFPENVKIFTDTDISEFNYPNLNLKVYGYAFTSQAHYSRPLSGFRVSGNEYNVLCAHTETDNPLSTYAPISSSELECSGLDYAALGHIHSKPEIFKSGNTVYAYSGCIAGRDFSEQGEKGGILVTLDKENGRTTVKTERITFCPWAYEEINIDISGKAESELKDLIQSESEKFKSTLKSREVFLRVTLKGYTSFTPDTSSLLISLSEDVTDIRSEITLLPHDGLELDYTVKGEMYRLLKSKLESADPKERKLAALALKYGLEALGG